MIEAKPVLINLALSLTLTSTTSAQDKLPPTEILHLMFQELARNPDAQRTTVTVPLMKRTQIEGLSESERFALGEVHFTNLQPVESKAAFEPFMTGRGARAAMAWQRVMQILFRGEGKADEVERMIPEYRERFPPSPERVYGAYFQVQNVAGVYAKKGDHQRVVELVEAEVSVLRLDAPYRSWLLPGDFIDSYEAIGRADQARAYVRDALASYSKELDQLNAPSVDFTVSDHVDGVLHRIEDHFYGSSMESDSPVELRALRTKELVGELEKQLGEIGS